MTDGDVEGWDALRKNDLIKSASEIFNVAWVPKVTRYNQKEIMQSQFQMLENSLKAVPLEDTYNAVTLPPLLQGFAEGVHLRLPPAPWITIPFLRTPPTATRPATELPRLMWTLTVFALPATVTSVSSLAVKTPADVLKRLGYRPTCVDSGADSSRSKIEGIYIFDESEAGEHNFNSETLTRMGHSHGG